MLIIPYVCAEFRDRNGNRIHRITPEMRGCLTEVPDAVRQDLLFDMLVADGSIKVPQNESQKKVLEQDPMVGVSPDGRSAVFAGGEYEGGAEVTRNKRAVRGTVAPIEGAEQSAVLKEEKPAKPGKKSGAEEKAAGAKTEK